MTENGYGTEMSDDEIGRYLYERGVGVLSLAREEVAYGIPVSYGYDGDHDRCLLDLGFGPESKKERFLETTRRSCLTVYEWQSPTDWHSVVATGDVNELGDDIAYDLEERYYEHARDVELSVFGVPPEDVDLQWYELSIDEVSGRTSR
ncbi:pyridoxamine 5'-phosphate oxidase family protein [Halobiforma nitratireducens]|nr:pyridoxamine 5'-phosphate oxidase family protein [Halobiforma nitratireducens]